MDTNKKIVERVDNLIEKLSRKDKHKLNSLIRMTVFITKSYFDEWKSWYTPKTKNKHIDVTFTNTIIIHNLYDLANVTQEDRKVHWMYNRNEQFKKHNNTKRMAKNPRQDNKGYISGSGGSNRNKIRYPKKCRKTAWKRFYILFPELKPTQSQ